MRLSTYVVDWVTDAREMMIMRAISTLILLVLIEIISKIAFIVK